MKLRGKRGGRGRGGGWNRDRHPYGSMVLVVEGADRYIYIYMVLVIKGADRYIMVLWFSWLRVRTGT